MKAIWTICFCLLFLKGLSQTVPIDSFFQKNATWTALRLVHTNFCSGCSGMDTTGIRYIIDKDTLVNSITYKRVSYRFIGSYGYDISFNGAFYQTTYHRSYDSTTSYQPLGRLRFTNDSLFFTNDYLINSSSAFGTYYPRGIEKLLYHFNASLGDTILFSRIVNIDSVIVQGHNIKRYTLGNGIYYLDGIGSENGLFRAIHGSSYSYGYYGICYKNNQLDFHYNPSVLPVQLNQNCFDIRTLRIPETPKAESEVTCYPSPLSGDDLYYSSTNFGQLNSLQILSMDGRVMLTYIPITSTGRLRFSFPSAIYFVRFNFKNASPIYKKVVKL